MRFSYYEHEQRKDQGQQEHKRVADISFTFSALFFLMSTIKRLVLKYHYKLWTEENPASLPLRHSFSYFSSMAADDQSGKSKPLITGKKLQLWWTGNWGPCFSVPFSGLIVSFDDIIGALSGAVDDRSLFYYTMLWWMWWWISFLLAAPLRACSHPALYICLEKFDCKWSALTESIYLAVLMHTKTILQTDQWPCCL